MICARCTSSERWSSSSETDAQSDSIFHALSLANEIENDYGKGALEDLQKIGFKFEDETTS